MREDEEDVKIYLSANTEADGFLSAFVTDLFVLFQSHIIQASLRKELPVFSVSELLVLTSHRFASFLSVLIMTEFI